MSANTSPIFTLSPALGFTIPTAANTKSDGSGTIGTDIFKALTADATNGSYVSSVRFCPFASVASTTVTATLLRIFLSNKTSGATTSADTWLLAEIAAASQVASHPTIATNFLEAPINRIIPASYTVLISIHATPAANTGWQTLVFAGNY